MLHRLGLDHIHEAFMLAKNKELLVKSSSVVFKNHHIVYALLKLFSMLLLKCIGIENEEMLFTAGNPGQIIMNLNIKRQKAFRFYEFYLL